MLPILLTSLLVANQSPPVLPAPPAPLPAMQALDDSGSGRFEIRDGAGSESWLGERFKEATWRQDNMLRGLNGRSPRTQEKYLSSPDYATVKQNLSMLGRWKVGDATHAWVFDAPNPEGGMSTRALELEDLSGPDGYHVRATVHCYDLPETCGVFQAKQQNLLAPKPAAAAGDLALRQWRNRVYAETCTTRQTDMAHPRYPMDALREGKGGTVIVGLLFNTCGNVRDAWLLQSAGHRSLDRAVLRKALEWQLDMTAMPPDGRQKRIAKVPVRFEVQN